MNILLGSFMLSLCLLLELYAFTTNDTNLGGAAFNADIIYFILGLTQLN